ncbi:MULTISPECIES: ABC transporter permease [Haloferax]|uniref:ABC transporter permease subunit n=1 Tax=Haloferax marinum TaxID=2666143 RepID=A0A6A8G571_9EURY|nr:MULTISPECIES: ABC transporter permease subunit [Haloferax]KAB1196881.1 ABC transporter permease subunit [Haloferax sp. CBA1150]MRW95897.1 ABC transporter permease subunit [Haloferax marinum]
MSDAPPRTNDRQDLVAIATRELRTVVRTPAVVALSVVFGLTVVAVTAAGSGSRGGYVPLVLDLVPFVEALVPLLAFALCYRAVLSDRQAGELDVLRTFDVSRPAYVGGVFLGRSLALVTVVFGSLLVAAAMVPVLSPDKPTFLALNEAADSPVAFVRFAVLAVLFALATAAVALAISAAARTARQALALAIGLLVAFLVGVDAAAVAALASGTVGIDAVPYILAVSPNGAFRSLVFGVAVETGGAVSPLTALLGLGGWVVGALAVAVVTAWRPVE